MPGRTANGEPDTVDRTFRTARIGRPFAANGGGPAAHAGSRELRPVHGTLQHHARIEGRSRTEVVSRPEHTQVALNARMYRESDSAHSLPGK